MNKLSMLFSAALLATTATWCVGALFMDPAGGGMGAFEDDLTRIAALSDVPLAQHADGDQADRVLSAPDLWTPLYPPQARPQVENRPTINWSELLEGIRPTRSHIVRDGAVHVLIISPDEPEGRYYGSGDYVGNLRIKSITPDEILFGYRKFRETHLRSVPRR